MQDERVNSPSGPLVGLRVLELAGQGPAPFCGMLLSDLGADVVRIDRKDASGGDPTDITSRGRRSIILDLKSPAGVAAALKLAQQADALIEAFRPGVMERLGLGPEVVLARNPRLVYGRMTGWGQTGPQAKAAGHDINFIALTGALHAIGTAERPVAPLNLVGDLGGGALYLAFGLLAGILNARQTGRGQVIDCAMTDGSASLMSMVYGMHAAGHYFAQRRSNLIDGAAPFYDTYQCADGRWLALGAIEPHFYRTFLDKAGLTDPLVRAQMDYAKWPELRARLASIIAGKTRAEWTAIFGDSDACATPVLAVDEAPQHPHNRARETFMVFEGVTQPAPAPRFSATPGRIQRPPPKPGAHTAEALRDWGLTETEIAALS